jgi:hypothetical protein
LPNFLGVSSLKRTLLDGTPNPAFIASGATVSHYDSKTNFALPGESAPVANPDTLTWARLRNAINVLSNDIDPDGNRRTIDRSSIQIVTLPANGTARVMTGPRAGQVVYTPNAGFHGDDTFTYDVADTEGNRSNVATVTVHVP